MTTRTRYILIALGILVIVAWVIVATSDPGLEVEAAQVARGPLEVTVTEEGRTRVRERYVVAAPVTGRLERIALEEGDRIAAGALVARLYPVPESPRDVGIAEAQVAAAEARQREAEAQVATVEAQRDQIQRDVRRSRALAADSILSQAELEQTELAVTSAERRVAAAQAALRAAEAQVTAARAVLIGASAEGTGAAVPVRAPTGGRVLRVLEESERVVPAGTPLVEIGDAARLDVVVEVLSEDAVRIAPGDPVRVDGWGGDTTLTGRVRLVGPDAFTEISALGVEEQRVRVYADLDNAPPALGSGYRVEAHIVTWTADDVLTVPTSALFRRGGTWHAFAIEEGTATLRALRLGNRSTAAAEVLDGLQADDTVILFPSDEVKDGVTVQGRLRDEG